MQFTKTSAIEVLRTRVAGIFLGEKSTIGLEGESFRGRLKNASLTFHVWNKHPIIGAGLGLLGYDKDIDINFSDYGSLTVLAEIGIPGIISFTGMFFALFYILIRIRKNIRHFDNLSAEKQRLVELAFYILIVEFLINFISGNSIVNFQMWNPLAIVFSIINTSLIETEQKKYTVTVVKAPLKVTFSNALAKYITSKKTVSETK
jgi:hypothetical protein